MVLVSTDNSRKKYIDLLKNLSVPNARCARTGCTGTYAHLDIDGNLLIKLKTQNIHKNNKNSLYKTINI